ncbi:MAG TPA: hypothetical protein VGM25_16095 [Caulobacteraceae bacterium]|jgi:hypothetical protein
MDAPDTDWDDGADPQDEAEVFDETHGSDEDPTGAASDDVDRDPDELTDVYDVTSALGDADDDEDEDETADDYDGDELDALDLDDEEDADEDGDDSLDDDLEDVPEADARAGLDRLIDRTAERAAPIEPNLAYVGDLDAVTNPRDDDVDKYETTRELSDEQLAELGYLRDGKQEVYAVKDEDQSVSTKPEDSRDWEERSFDTDAEQSILEGGQPAPTGSGAKADDVEDEADPHEQDLLDEGLEETFPASDPVSAKHIT